MPDVPGLDCSGPIVPPLQPLQVVGPFQGSYFGVGSQIDRRILFDAADQDCDSNACPICCTAEITRS